VHGEPENDRHGTEGRRCDVAMGHLARRMLLSREAVA
jgi:hypothetical protein